MYLFKLRLRVFLTSHTCCVKKMVWTCSLMSSSFDTSAEISTYDERVAMLIDKLFMLEISGTCQSISDLFEA